MLFFKAFTGIQKPRCFGGFTVVFSSPLFMFVFLPAVMLVYYLVPRRYRNGVLLLSSLFFYFWGEQLYTGLMIFSTIVDYTHGRLVEYYKGKGNDRGARLAVLSSVIINLSLLFFFKYWDFIAQTLQNLGIGFLPVLGIHLPIGISFYTFQTMSYTIDVYRGDARAQRNILNFGTFVTMFPQLIAGPIIRYKDLAVQLSDKEIPDDPAAPRRDYSSQHFADGVRIFTIGLAKKILLANNIGQLWDTYKAMTPANLTIAGAWLGVLAFAMQIYFDFSGYSDMAIGLGRMFGFEFKINFDYPYISSSITEFWRRWHMSLGTWFREYVYIPLGGSRCSKIKQMRNILIVWALTGIWHGASWNYLLWGLYFCLILVLEKTFLLKWLEPGQTRPAAQSEWAGISMRLRKIISHIYSIFLILVGWAIFALEDFSHMKAYLAAMFGLGSLPFADSALTYYLHSYGMIMIICIIASLPLGKKLWRKLFKKGTWPEVTATLILVAAALVMCTAYMVAGTYNPFLYFRF